MVPVSTCAWMGVTLRLKQTMPMVIARNVRGVIQERRGRLITTLLVSLVDDARGHLGLVRQYVDFSGGADTYRAGFGGTKTTFPCSLLDETSTPNVAPSLSLKPQRMQTEPLRGHED